MVLRHFNLREQPFGVTPDPRYLYASSTHREALASLLYGIESGLGFVTLTANPGMGKTTLLFEALRRMKDTARTVFLFQTIASPFDLVRALLIDLGIKETRGSLIELQTLLNEVLVEQAATGQQLIVVIDEAQNLDDSVLEAVRMLSNFETASKKLMHIILSGQLQLVDKLAQPHLLQLRQRVSIFAHLEPLSSKETAAYIQHRLKVAGHSSSESLFTAPALTLIARESRGIPRNINNICFNALTLACALQRETVDAEMIQEVIGDLNIQSMNTHESVPEGESTGKTKRGHLQTISRPKLSKTSLGLISFVTCSIVVLFGWLIEQHYRIPSFDRAVAASAKAAPTLPAVASGTRQDASKEKAVAPSSVSTTVGSHIHATTAVESVSLKTGKRLVSVHEGQSLSSICAGSFGHCRPEVLREIIRINPWITDPNHIVSGQKVAIPVLFPNSIDKK